MPNELFGLDWCGLDGRALYRHGVDGRGLPWHGLLRLGLAELGLTTATVRGTARANLRAI
jgi:hypothetical protein